jgi:L-threonine kinase
MTGETLGTASALAPGTCGELVQGMTGGVDFLVTCPINQFSRATVTLTVSRGVTPDDCVRGIDQLPKTRQAVALTLNRLQNCLGVSGLIADVAVANPVPVGKGMGSSSADITAAVYAVCEAAKVRWTPETVAEIALAVEPTDGVMFPGIAVFDHRSGRIAEPLGMPPPMEVIVIDRGGQVDTMEFNQVDRTSHWQSVVDQTDEALELVREGILRCDPELVGRGATISARSGGPEDAGPLVEQAVDFAAQIGAVGVNVAHSGTVVGVLLDARKRQSKPAFREAQREFAAAASVQHFRIIGGGVRPG